MNGQTTIYGCIRGKNPLFTHAIVVKTGCTGKLLQGEICRSSIDKTKNMSVIAMAFDLPASYVYI